MTDAEKLVEQILCREGFAFALASSVGTSSQLAEAREFLKQAIIRALLEASKTHTRNH